MHRHRLLRLARITQGAALVGVGFVDIACSKEQAKPEQPHINATATAFPSAAPSAVGSALPTINAPPEPKAADAGPVPVPHTINAPPRSPKDPSH
jgi:hypothetical protein